MTRQCPHCRGRVVYEITSDQAVEGTCLCCSRVVYSGVTADRAEREERLAAETAAMRKEFVANPRTATRRKRAEIDARGAEIVTLLAQGLTQRKIAERLNIAKQSVNARVKRLRAMA